MRLIPRFRKRLEVNPNQVGLLYREKVFQETLKPGVYRMFDPFDRYELLTFSTAEQQATVTNQEVLSRDNVAFRFSFIITYRLVDAEKLIAKLNFDDARYPFLDLAQRYISHPLQIKIRQDISQIDSEQINEKRTDWEEISSDEINRELETYGIEVLKAQMLDVTFPKSIQELFAKQLEARIRSKTDLENARTAVATARALKNAAELMQGDDSIRFFQYMETISKIAAKGKHTFLIGEMPPAVKVKEP
ncbi:MAG: SPFH domain-containing protein [Verrucomicrobiota bacterium]